MQIKANIIYKAELELKQNEILCHGSFQLIEKVNEFKIKYGFDPKKWPTLNTISNNIDIVINEFILKAKGEYKLSYQHEEICHCRTVKTETVIQSIKQDCHTIKEISRATKAGTGCGTCIPNLKILLNEIFRKSE